jgi:hypothetical protein
MEVYGSFKMCVPTCKTVWWRNSDDQSPNFHRHENIKSQKGTSFQLFQETHKL